MSLGESAVRLQKGQSVAWSRDRLPSLTGLRFWAALMVVLYHLTSQVGAVQPFSAMTMFGRSGVTFFFVLSGFVLAWTYLDRPTQLRVFLWRRFARLWPLVAVTGAISLTVFWVIGAPRGLWEAMTTFLFLQAWHPDWAVGANGAAWSLSDEAFFYLVFPAVLAVAAARRSRTALWAACAVTTVGLWVLFATQGWTSWVLDYLPLTRLVQFVVGVLCAVMMRQGRRAPLGFWPAVGLVIAYHAALIPWALLAGQTSPAGPYTGSQWWATSVFALLIMAAAQADLDGRTTAVRDAWSVRLGRWSYAWYLIHEVIIRLWNYYSGGDFSGAAVAVEWAVIFVASVAAAGVLYVVVEHPAERWLRARGPKGRPASHHSRPKIVGR